MATPPKYEDLVLKVAEMERRETALRESLTDKRDEYNKLGDRYDALQQRLTVAGQRAGDLEQMLSDVPHIHFEGCDFQGFNSDGSEPFEFTDGPVKKIKSIRLIGWRCEGPLNDEDGSDAKVKLAIAEKELADLHEKIESAGEPPHTDYWHQSLYEAEKKVVDAKAGITGGGNE